jgi:hypothetical protein
MRRKSDKTVSDNAGINHPNTLQNRSVIWKSPIVEYPNPIQLFPDKP